MDSWEENTNRIKQAVLAEEPEAALSGAMDLLANLGRVLEMIAGDTDRIATALEGDTRVPAGEAPATHIVPAGDESTVHDL